MIRNVVMLIRWHNLTLIIQNKILQSRHTKRPHYHDVIMSTMASESPASRLFTEPFTPRHWPVFGEFTGDRRFYHTKGEWRGKCFHLMTSSCKHTAIHPSIGSLKTRVIGSRYSNDAQWPQLNAACCNFFENVIFTENNTALLPILTAFLTHSIRSWQSKTTKNYNKRKSKGWPRRTRGSEFK